MRFDDLPNSDEGGDKWWWGGIYDPAYRYERQGGSGWLYLDGKVYRYKTTDECKRLMRLLAFL